MMNQYKDDPNPVRPQTRLPVANEPESHLDRYPTLVEALTAKNSVLADHLSRFEVRLSIEDAEDIITTLYEIVGHMAEDVGTQGYEYRLLHRARHHARILQASLLVSILPVDLDDLGETSELREANEP